MFSYGVVGDNVGCCFPRLFPVYFGNWAKGSMEDYSIHILFVVISWDSQCVSEKVDGTAGGTEVSPIFCVFEIFHNQC